MSSLAKIEANRRNGAKSKGPITPEGKARSAMNARKHGFTSEKIVLTTEDQPRFDRMHQEFTTHYNPLSVVEEQYVLEMTWNRWRLHRLWNAETVYIEDQLTRPVNNQGKRPHVATGLLIADLTRTGEALDTIPRYELRLNRLFNRSKLNLLEAQEIRRNRVILDDDDPEPGPAALTLVPVKETTPTEPDPEPEQQIATNEPTDRAIEQPPAATNEPTEPVAEPEPEPEVLPEPEPASASTGTEENEPTAVAPSEEPQTGKNEPTEPPIHAEQKPEQPKTPEPGKPDRAAIVAELLQKWGMQPWDAPPKRPNEPK